MKSKMIMLIIALSVFTVSLIGIAQSVDADESDNSDMLDTNWIGDQKGVIDGQEFTYSKVFTDGEELKYQTRFIVNPSKIENKQIVIPNDLESMSVRIIEFSDSKFDVLKEYQVSQINFYVDSEGKKIDIPDAAPGKTSGPVNFGATVMKYGTDGKYISSSYVNMSGKIMVGKYNLSDYLKGTGNPLIYNWHKHSVEECVDKISPGPCDAPILFDGKEGDYYWVVDYVEENAGTYIAKAMSNPDSKNYKGPASVEWTIDKYIVEKFKYKPIVFNNSFQSPILRNVSINTEYNTIDEATGAITSDIPIEYSLTLKNKTDFTVTVTPQIYADTYNGDKGYSVIFVNENVESAYDYYEWIIKPKELKKEYVIFKDNFTEGDRYKYTGEPIGPMVEKVYDYEIEYTLSKYKVSGSPQIAPGDYTITVTSDDKNYYGSVYFKWGIDKEPVALEGEIHVNVIHTDGTLVGEMFTDSNTFIYPYPSSYRMYDDEGNYIGNEHIDIHRYDYRIVVLDANGNVVIDEMNPSNPEATHVTSSEWNHIEIYGVENFYGCITGSFYVSFDNALNEIGDEISVDGITYTVTSLDNKTVSVTGYEAGIQAGIAIPDYVEGFKVTKIGAKAFYGCKTITSVDLGENITSVGIKAFANCTKLETVVFDDALKTISAYAFYNCGKLTSIDLPDKVRTIGSYAFYKCNALTSVSFDDSLKTVGTKAFTVSFENASGKVIKQTAKNLAGKTFEGSDKVLKLVA